MTGPAIPGERRVDDPVQVTDNGVRSFLPPTFCFDLTDRHGDVVATVSRVVLAARGVTDFEAVEALRRDGSFAVGAVSEYDAGPDARVPGLQFTVTDVGSP